MKQNQILEFVVTARPSWARVSTLVRSYFALVGPDSCRISLVGPAISDRYGDLSTIIDLPIHINTFSTLHDSDSLDSVALTCLDGGASLTRFWRHSRPNAVLVIADRTETLGVAVASSLMQIPLIHLQGGEISGSIDDKIRRANSKLADLHLTTNERSRHKLLQDGESSDLIHIIGCPSVDLVKEVIEEDSIVLDMAKIGGVGATFDFGSPYGIIMFHPDTSNEPENSFWVSEIIQMIKKSDINWFWFWPNPDHGTSIISKLIRRHREFGDLDKTRFIININPKLFISLALKSKIMVGNSSFGIRESAYIGLSVINLGKRQADRETAENVLTIQDRISSGTLWELSHARLGKTFKQSFLYGTGDAGLKGAKILQSWSPKTKLKS